MKRILKFIRGKTRKNVVFLRELSDDFRRLQSTASLPPSTAGLSLSYLIMIKTDPFSNYV